MNTILSAGKLETPVTIERNMIRENDFAVGPPDWQQVLFVWCWVRPLTGRQLEYGREMVSTVTHDVMLNNPFLDVRPNDRLRFEGRILFVRAVVKADDGKWSLRLLCDEIE